MTSTVKTDGNQLPFSDLNWGAIAPLRLVAKHLAAGLYAGAHQSVRRGAGIEFGGHRKYLPGDDLRRLDYRALARHGRLLVREFETETERRVCLVVDAKASMAFSGSPNQASKFAFAALMAAALGRISVSAGDLVALDWLGGLDNLPLTSGGGREAFSRLTAALVGARLGGTEPLTDPDLQRLLVPLARRASPGSVVVLFSDLLDLPPSFSSAVAALSTRRRKVVVVQTLDPVEASFPFDGPLKLRPSAGAEQIETDARTARSGYLAALKQLQDEWQDTLVRHGGGLLSLRTDDDPADALRQLLALVRGEPQPARLDFNQPKGKSR